MANGKKVFPTHITILGRKFKIIFTTDIMVNDKPAGGAVDFDLMQIEIDEGLSPANKLKTLLHEVTHIGLDVSGIDQTMPDFVVESICQTNGNVFYDFLIAMGCTSE